VSDLVTAVIAPQPATFNPGAPLVELETQLRTAVACADAANKTAGALILHMVEQRKQTVRSIANTVGKSAGWVHGMLVRARADYVGDPFGGPVRKAARERADARDAKITEPVFSQAEQPVKLKINGQSVNTDAFSDAAKKQIEDVIAKLPTSWEPPPADESAEVVVLCPCPMCNKQHAIKAEAPAPPSAPMFDYDPKDDPETQPGDSEEVIRRRGFLFRAADGLRG
jgi:hypothetical protein